jgi:hypothetical protein
VESLSFHLSDNVAYDLPSSKEEDIAMEEKATVYEVPIPRPHYHPINPSTREYNEPPIPKDFNFDDITLDDMPFIQHLATTNPGQFQLFLLVKMQRVLLEIQTERNSASRPILQAETVNTEQFSAEPDLPTTSTTQSRDSSKDIVYSTVKFEEEEMKSALGEPLVCLLNYRFH